MSPARPVAVARCAGLAFAKGEHAIIDAAEPDAPAGTSYSGPAVLASGKKRDPAPFPRRLNSEMRIVSPELPREMRIVSPELPYVARHADLGFVAECSRDKKVPRVLGRVGSSR